MHKLKVLFSISILFIANFANAISFKFLVPNCMNSDYWNQAASSIETAEEKLDAAINDCTEGLDAEFATCTITLSEFPPAELLCDAAAIAGCGASIGVFGETVGLGIDDTTKIIKNCISLIPIAAYAVSMTESGDAAEATPCMLDIFGTATSVIPELKDLDIDDVINDFKSFNADVTNTIQDIVGAVTSTVNSIDSGFNKIINATKPFKPLSGLLSLIEQAINVVFSFVPIMATVEEMAPLLIMANVCNNYSPGLGGIACLALIQDTCSQRFKGKQGSVPPSAKQNSDQAEESMSNAQSIINQIANETQNQINKQAEDKEKSQALATKYKKCKKIEKLISSIPIQDRNQIPEADIEYFDSNCKSILKN